MRRVFLTRRVLDHLNPLDASNTMGVLDNLNPLDAHGMLVDGAVELAQQHEREPERRTLARKRV